MSRWTQTKPCEACPYRRDAPTGVWDAAEFENVKAQDHDFGNTFGCHLDATRPKEDWQPCVGWLADQKRRGVPNIPLRMMLMTTPGAVDVFEAVNENDPKLYASIEEMVAANAGKRFPSRAPKAKRLVAKLEKRPRAARRG